MQKFTEQTSDCFKTKNLQTVKTVKEFKMT